MRFSTLLMSGLLGLACFSACADSHQPEISDEVLARATKLAQSALIVDTHIDVPSRLHDGWSDVTQATAEGDFDYPRAVKGGLNLPFMSIYTPASMEAEGGSFQLANVLIDSMEALVGRAPDKFVMVLGPDEARAAKAAGKIGIALGMENGTPIEGKLEHLQFFYDRGIRYITLSHALSNHIADSSYDTNRQWNGLSPFGREVVEEMNRLGIMVDVSHVSDDAFYQAVEISKVPVIASHSSVRHFTPGFERNMSDEMIQRLAKSGGVIQINFGSLFLRADTNEWYKVMVAARTAWLEESGNAADSEAAKSWSKAYWAENNFPYATIADVADHIDRVVKLSSHEHVGIGSDYDGVGDSLPHGLKDVSTYPVLIAELLQRGYSEEQLAAILGGNLMRVWAEVEAFAVAASMSSANPASIYCSFLGGQSRSVTDAQNGAAGLCQLPSGESCEEWALYRGSCALSAEINEPFAFCEAIGNSPVLPASGGEPRKLVPQALLAPLRKQGLINAELAEPVQAAVRWRCMQSQIYICPVGANLPCEEQADLSQIPTQAMQNFCSENPDAAGLPAYVTGRATVYAWSCKSGAAIAGKQVAHADGQGYLKEFWHLLQQ